MTIYLVTIRNPYGHRYIDSLWVVQDHAVKRRKELRAELNRSGHETGWDVWVSEATVPDAELKDRPEETEAPEDLEGLELKSERSA